MKVFCQELRRWISGLNESEAMRSFNQFWFISLCLLIAAISAYDAALIVKFRDHINLMEENPAGRWLLRLGNGQVGIFVRAKLAGTLVVITVLAYLWRYHRRTAFPVTTSLAAWQTALLTYLTFG